MKRQSILWARSRVAQRGSSSKRAKRPSAHGQASGALWPLGRALGTGFFPEVGGDSMGGSFDIGSSPGTRVFARPGEENSLPSLRSGAAGARLVVCDLQKCGVGSYLFFELAPWPVGAGGLEGRWGLFFR